MPTRPLKEGSVPTYQQKVALGFPDILASEMDADLDTIYAAWNGGVATANINDGSVTTPKLAAAPNGVATGNLNDLAVTVAKLAVGAAIRQINSKIIPAGSFNAGTWTQITTLPLTTAGGRVLLIAAAGWLAAVPANSSSIIFSVGFGRDLVTPAAAAGVNHTVVAPTATGNLNVPLPMYATIDSPPAGAHTYYLSCNVSSTAGFLVMEANAGQMWAIELA